MIAAHDALVVAAAVLLPGTAFIAGRVAYTTWRQQRRRRGPWVVASVRGLTTTAGRNVATAGKGAGR